MKLTFDQLIVLRDGARFAEKRYLAKTQITADADEASRAYWTAEAETARQLVSILADALTVEIESVHLTPSTDEAQASHPPAHPPADSPTGLPSPSPRALRLANSLSRPTLRRIVALHQAPGHRLSWYCNTILERRGETEPLAAQDLAAAAIALLQTSHGRPHPQPASQDHGECPGSPQGAPEAQACPDAPAPHPTGESIPHKSSAQPSSTDA